MVVALVATTLYGCADNTGRKETGGTLIGMALGGFLGAQFGAGSGKFVAAALGAVAGGLLGNKIGRNLDENDRLEKRRALSEAFYNTRSGQTVTWNNPSSGNGGSYTPLQTFQLSDNSYCREMHGTLTVDGRERSAVATACHEADGTWRLRS